MPSSSPPRTAASSRSGTPSGRHSSVVAAGRSSAGGDPQGFRRWAWSVADDVISLRHEFESFRSTFRGREGVAVAGMTCSSVSLALSAAPSPGSQAMEALAASRESVQSVQSLQSEAGLSKMLRSAADEVLAEVRDEQHTFRCALESEHMLIRRELEGLRAQMQMQLAGSEERLEQFAMRQEQLAPELLNADGSYKGRLEAVEEAVLNLGRNLVSHAELHGRLESEHHELQQRIEEFGDAWHLAERSSSQRFSRLEEGLRASNTIVAQLQEMNRLTDTAEARIHALSTEVNSQRHRFDEMAAVLRVTSLQSPNGCSPDARGDSTSALVGSHSRRRSMAASRSIPDAVRAVLSVNPRRQPSEATRMCRAFWAWAELLPSVGHISDSAGPHGSNGSARRQALPWLEDAALHAECHTERYHPMTPSAQPPSGGSARNLNFAGAWLDDDAQSRAMTELANGAGEPAESSGSGIATQVAELHQLQREVSEEMRELPEALREFRELRDLLQAAGPGDLKRSIHSGEAANTRAVHLSAQLETRLEKLSAQVADLTVGLDSLKLQVDSVEARSMRQAAEGGDLRSAIQAGESASSRAMQLTTQLETMLETQSKQVADLAAGLDGVRLQVDSVDARTLRQLADGGELRGAIQAGEAASSRAMHATAQLENRLETQSKQVADLAAGLDGITHKMDGVEARTMRQSQQPNTSAGAQAPAPAGEATSTAAMHLAAQLEGKLEMQSKQVADLSAGLDGVRLRLSGVEGNFTSCLETTGLRVNALDDRIMALTEERQQASATTTHDEQPKLWAEMEELAGQLAVQREVSAETMQTIETLTDDVSRWRCEANCRTACKGKGHGLLSPMSEVLQEQREGAGSAVTEELREMAAMAGGTLRTTQELMRWNMQSEVSVEEEDTAACEAPTAASTMTPTTSPSRFPWGINGGLRSAAAGSPEPGPVAGAPGTAAGPLPTSGPLQLIAPAPVPQAAVPPAGLQEELERLALGLSHCCEEQQQIFATVKDEAKLALFEARQSRNQGIKAKAELEQVFADLDEQRLETSEWRASLAAGHRAAAEDMEVKQELASLIADSRQRHTSMVALEENQMSLEGEVARLAMDLDECCTTAAELAMLGSQVQQAVESMQEQPVQESLLSEVRAMPEELAAVQSACSKTFEEELVRVVRVLAELQEQRGNDKDEMAHFAEILREQDGSAKEQLATLALDADDRHHHHEVHSSNVAEQLSALHSQVRGVAASLEEEGAVGAELRHVASELREQASEVQRMAAVAREGERGEIEQLMSEVRELAADASEGRHQMPAEAEKEFDHVHAELSELRVEAGRTAGRLSTLGLQVHQVMDENSRPSVPAPVEEALSASHRQHMEWSEELREQQKQTLLTEQRLQILAVELLGPHQQDSAQRCRVHSCDDEGSELLSGTTMLSGAVEEWRAGVAELRSALCRTWETEDARSAQYDEAAVFHPSSAARRDLITRADACNSPSGGARTGGFAAWVFDVDLQGQRLAARVDVLTASQRSSSEEAIALRSDLSKAVRDAERASREAAHKAEAAVQELLGGKLKEVREHTQKEVSRQSAEIHARMAERSAALVADMASQRAMCAKMGGDLEALQGHVAEVVEDSVEMRRQVLSLCEARSRRANCVVQEAPPDIATRRGNDESIREVRQACRETAERLSVLADEVASLVCAQKRCGGCAQPEAALQNGETMTLGEVHARCLEVAGKLTMVQGEVDRLTAQVSAGEQNASRGLCLLQQGIETLQAEMADLRRALRVGR